MLLERSSVVMCWLSQMRFALRRVRSVTNIKVLVPSQAFVNSLIQCVNVDYQYTTWTKKNILEMGRGLIKLYIAFILFLF